MVTKKYLNELTYEVIGCAIEVQKIMGGGLLESVYQECMQEELRHRKMNFLTEMKVPVIYKGKTLDVKFRCDLLMENQLLVELKAVKEIVPAFKAQILNYMNLLKVPKGILINFHCFNIFKEGQQTFVNEYYRSLPDD